MKQQGGYIFFCEGEARDAFEALAPEEQQRIITFAASLASSESREPFAPESDFDTKA